MADGRSKKAAATKKAAAVRARASRDTGGKRNAERIDKGPQVKMGIAYPGGAEFTRYMIANFKPVRGSARANQIKSKGIELSDIARPKKIDPKPTKIRDSSPPTVKNRPPTKIVTSKSHSPTPRYVMQANAGPVSRSPRTNQNPSKTTFVLKDPTARWQAGQSTLTAVGKPIARASGTGRAAKAAATKKKK